MFEKAVQLVRSHGLDVSARKEILQDEKGKDYFDGKILYFT